MTTMLVDGSRYGACLTGSCVALVLSILGIGCSALGPCDTSDDGNPPDPYYDGTTVDGSYMSSEWTGPLLPFTGGKRYDFYHGLGCTPRSMECWVSFSAEGVQNGSLAQSSGNLCVIQEANDEFIRVKNDTCSEMYVLVTAWTPGCDPASDPDAGSDAGADGG